MTDRVAYIVGSYPEPSELFIQREVAGLRRMGVDVTVMSLRRPAQPESGVVYRSRVVSMGTFMALLWMLPRPAGSLRAMAVSFKLIGSPLEMLKAFRNVAAAAEFARTMRERRIDRLHAHFANMPATVGLMVAAMTGAEFSFTAHARDVYVRPTLLREKAAASSCVVTCTEFNIRLLKEMLTPGLSERFVAVYHGIDTSVYAPGDAQAAEPPVIISVGRLIEKKGFDVLIGACAIMKDAGLVFRCEIAGEGVLRDALERQIEARELNENVKLLGQQSQQQLVERYREATLCVLPCVVASDGDHDGLPNVLLEAAACGTPCISTPVGGVPELIRDGETGLLVPERDAQATAGAMKRLLEDAELRQRLAEAARREIEKRFAIEANVRRLAEVLGLRGAGS